MTRSADGGRRSSAPSLVFLVWLFGFIAFGGTTLLGWHPVARAAGVLLYGGPVVLWAVLRYRGPVDRLDLAVVAAVVAHLVVSLLSLDRESSMEMSAVVVAYACTFWLARRIAGDARLRRLSATAVATAVVFWLAVLAVTWIGEKVTAIEHLGWPPVLDARQPYVWGSINTLPVLALLVGPFIAWLPGGPGRRIMVTIWLASAVVVVPLSVGRAGWLGVGVAIASLEPLLRFPVSQRVISGLRRRNRLAWTTVGISAVVLAGTLILVFSRGGEVVASALDSRVRLWQQALSLFSADPLTGAGPSTFGWARLAHVPDYVDRVAAKDVHSVPLQTLADGGLILVVAMAVVVAAWVNVMFERRRLLNVRQRLSIAALIGYAAVALLDDLSFLPTVTVMLILLAAWAIPVANPPAPRATGLHAIGVPALILAAAVITTPAVIAMTASRLHAAEGRHAAVAGDWDRSLVAFEDATELHPSNAQYWMSVGLAASMAGQSDAAVMAYERARSISPGDPRPWGALATLAQDQRSEIRLLEEAARRSNDPRYAFRLGSALFDNGDVERAGRFFAIGAALQPEWFASIPKELWPAVSDALPEAISTVASIGGHNPEEAQWNAGLALGNLPEGVPAPWRAVQFGLDGDIPAAEGLLGQARGEGPSSLRADQAASALARLACDRTAFDRAEMRLAARGVDVQEGGHPVSERRSGLYRDAELGDYQPLTDRSVDVPPPWPLGLIQVPDCGW